MAFILDKQTLSDLKIFNKPQSDSIFGLFNKARTSGASKILEEMFRYPLSDESKIRSRLETLKFFMENETSLRYTFDADWFDSIEHYLSDTDERARLKAHADSMRRKINRAIGADTAYELIHKAILSTIKLCSSVRTLVEDLGTAPESLMRERELLLDLLASPTFEWTAKESGTKRLSYKDVARYDDLLRYKGLSDFRKLLDVVYRIDVYRSVARTAIEKGFTLPTVVEDGDEDLFIQNLRHPLLPQAVPNTVSVSGGEKVIFLTGANMAGKSTFMKAFGTTLFLAHMGFPVPATEMRFRVSKGMYTTINLPDNMHAGLSHFYAEVKRLRKVADQVNRTGRIIVIFDELFRGTNVKDAHEGTVEVLRAFAEREDCLLMISTHIIEAGEDLKDKGERIKFVYFPTLMGKDGKPRYTYTLTEGITADRHGMMIVKNEKIIDILNPEV